MTETPGFKALNAVLPPVPAESIGRILRSALQAVDPDRLVRNALQRRGDQLTFPDGSSVILSGVSRVYLIGIGKAALPMTRAAAEILSGVDYRGLAVTKGPLPEDEQRKLPGLPVLPAGHPEPDQASLQAGQSLLDILESAGPEDLVLVLLSGGGSSLVCLPADPLTLEDLQQVNSLLLESGADIQEINTIRKHLSRIKGGQLARAAHPARLVTLVLSDVIGDPLSAVASGPTVPDPTTYQDALEVVQAYRLEKKLPEAALERLRSGAAGNRPETLKPGDPGTGPGRTFVIGNNRTGALAAREQARREGFQSAVLTTYLQGEARQAGAFCAAVLHEMALFGSPLSRPGCLIAGGETTVTISDPKQAGLGGRSLEAALAAVPVLSGVDRAVLITLATDGEDGPTDAAGAVVTGKTLSQARELGLDPERHLENHSAYNFFQSLGDLIRIGPTRTNVNDLWFLFTYQED
jgi:hydroxypyruvate reductase